MTVQATVLIPSKHAENTQTTQYTATGVRTIIDKFTVTNTSASNATISVNLVASGDTAGNDNLIIDARNIAPGETYSVVGVVGHSLAPSGFISTLASAATALTIRASGREIS